MKNRVIIGLPLKGQKQVADLQRNALASLTLPFNCTKWMKDVSALRWRSATCFWPFCGSPNYPIYSLLKTVSLLVALFLTHKISTRHEMRHSFIVTRFEQTNLSNAAWNDVIIYVSPYDHVHVMVCGEEMSTLVKGCTVFFRIHEYWRKFVVPQFNMPKRRCLLVSAVRSCYLLSSIYYHERGAVE